MNYLFSVLLSLFLLTEPLQLNNLYVAVLYDYGNGNVSGVGAGVPVSLSRNGEFLEFAVTDELSKVNFQVENGHYDLSAYPPQENPIYRWVCRGGKSVDEPQEYMVLYCELEFWLLIPYITN